MSSKAYDEAEIAAFIQRHGVTRCPTACVAPTHSSGSEKDRVALRERADRREAARARKQKMTALLVA